MKVFLSWSGKRSQMMASALRDWLPLVLHFSKPWLSETDIAAGERWALTLAKELDASNFGILCLTRDNVDSPWLLFEAGSIAKFLQNSTVIPFLLDLDLRELSGPLTQFQAKKVNRDATLDLVRSINQAAETPVDPATLGQLFDVLWPSLESRLAAIPPMTGPANPARPQGEILEELVSIIRALDQRTSVQQEQLSLLTRESWDEEVRALLLKGQKINAIKLVRERVGLGLTQAKDFVNALHIVIQREVADGSQVAAATGEDEAL